MAECAARLEITGILTKDLEIRVGKDGKSKYCYFTLRVDKPGYKDKNTGEYVKVDSDFFNMRANGYIPDYMQRKASPSNQECGKEGRWVSNGLRKLDMGCHWRQPHQCGEPDLHVGKQWRRIFWRCSEQFR